jgi:hypothetical protein
VFILFVVFNGFVRLRASEKEELQRRTREYNAANPAKRELVERQSFAAAKKITLVSQRGWMPLLRPLIASTLIHRSPSSTSCGLPTDDEKPPVPECG